MSRFITKAADANSDIEQAVFQLAYDKLQGKLYNLLPYLVGFELVNKSDDNSKVIGVFGFKAQNGQILYVPVFFINGKIKELDIMYSKNNNQFYPLNEDFASLFLKDDATGVGTPFQGDRKEVENNMPSLDYRDLVIPPRTGRISYASCLDYIEGSEDIVKTASLKLLEKNADLLEAFRHYYTDEQIAKAFVVKQAEVKEPVVRVVKLGEEALVKISDERKKEVTDKGYFIKDARADTDKSKFGTFQFTETFTNPGASGFYSYVTELGTIRYGLVLMKPYELRSGFSSDESIVVDLEAEQKGQSYIVPNNQIFIKDNIQVQDFKAIHKLLEDPAEATPSYSDKYILINENLKTIQPFIIEQNMRDENGIRRLLVDPDGDAICTERFASGRKEKEKEDTRKIVLVLTKKTGDRPEYKGKYVYIPKGYKLMKIKTSTYISRPYRSGMTDEERKKDSQEIKAEEARIKSGKPGCLHNVTRLLGEKGVFKFNLRANGSEYFASIGEATKKYENPMLAKIGMVLDFGLDAKQGEEMVDCLIADTPLKGYIKLAYTGDYAPTIIDEQPQADQFGNPTTYGIPYQAFAPQDISYTEDPTQQGKGVKEESPGIESDVNSAVQMASAGQKEIFDTQAIATIAKYIDPSNKVVSYIPNFVQSLDHLGRILFMIQWDTEKFQKMYGLDELPELMELVKNVFNNLGDLIIFLKRKFPDVSINNKENSSDI
jgi:hypothetical protein